VRVPLVDQHGNDADGPIQIRQDAPSLQNASHPASGGSITSITAVSRKLRVAVISDAIAGRNGVGTYYPDLLSHLEPEVESIELLSPADPADRELERFSVPMPGDRSQRLAWPRVRGLRARLDRQKPNLVVVPAVGAFSYFAIKYAQKRNIPFVLVNHTNFDQLLSLYWPDAVSRPLGWLLNRVYSWGMRSASAVAAMDSESLGQARDLGIEMVRVMGTPISHEFIHTPVKAPSGKVTKICFVGRLAAEKGLARLLAAAKTLGDTEFVVIGDGPLRNQVQKVARRHRNLHYRGWLPRQRVLEEIDAADALILPSSVETFGTVALEALARRRYVLVGRDCGISKWPSFANGLFYIEPDQSIADAVRRLQAIDPSERDAIGRQSWDAVKAFNDYTIRVWLRFMADAAGLKSA
jgi:glycosyltransferase involved in cell wall biosynthesis